jgi:hypothetical protein
MRISEFKMNKKMKIKTKEKLGASQFAYWKNI